MAANRRASVVGRPLLRKLNFIAALLFAAVSSLTGALGHLLKKNRFTALGTTFPNGTIPAGELTFRIAAAAVEDLATPRFSLLNLALFAFRTVNPQIDWLFERANIFTLRIAGTAQEPTVFAPANLHGAAAFFASFIHLDFFNDLDLAVPVPGKVLRVLTFGIARTS